jgi:hypothetical protein
MPRAPVVESVGCETSGDAEAWWWWRRPPMLTPARDASTPLRAPRLVGEDRPAAADRGGQATPGAPGRPRRLAWAPPQARVWPARSTATRAGEATAPVRVTLSLPSAVRLGRAPMGAVCPSRGPAPARPPRWAGCPASSPDAGTPRAGGGLCGKCAGMGAKSSRSGPERRGAQAFSFRQLSVRFGCCLERLSAVEPEAAGSSPVDPADNDTH